MGDVSEAEWSLILAETPGLKRIIEENEAFERAQLWGGLFNASEAYFTGGSDGGDDVGVSMVEVEGSQEGGEADAGEGEYSGRVVEANDVGGAGERDSAGEDVVGDAIAEFAYWVVLAGGGCVVVLGVFAVLSIVFGWRGA